MRTDEKYAFKKAELAYQRSYAKVLHSHTTDEDIPDDDWSEFQKNYSSFLECDTTALFHIERKIGAFLQHETDHMDEYQVDFLQQISKDIRAIRLRN